MQKWFQYAFLLLGACTVFDYLLNFGTPSAFVMMGLVWLAGIANFIYALRMHRGHTAALYLLCTIALNMGYWLRLF